MIKRLHLFSGWAWLIFILALCAYSTNALLVQNRIQFDLMALLPEGESQNMKAVSQLMEDTKLTNQIILMIGHPDSTLAKTAFQELRAEISAISLPLLEQNSKSIAESYHTLFRELHPHRTGFLSFTDRELLLKGEGKTLLQQALSDIFTPFSTSGPVQIKDDPFFLYPHYIKSIQPDTSFKVDEQGELYIESDKLTWYLYKAHLTDGAFSLQTQEKITNGLSPILSKLEREQGLKILRLGAVFYAQTGAQQAQEEMSTIGVLSFLGIILMLVLVFKTLRPLALAIAVILTGIVSGLSACLALFGSIHILSFVFGCSLVGITVDYALHYFCAGYTVCNTNTDRFAVLKSLMPALPLGVLSSCLGYGLLIIVPFPGIQQMAVMACIGLLCAFLSVCFWGPYFIKNTYQAIPSVGLKIQKTLETLANFGYAKKSRFLLTLLALGIGSFGLYQLTFDDDIRNLQSLNPTLKSQEQRIKSLIHWDSSSKFLCITGTNIEAVLQQEETLVEKLEILKNNRVLSGYHSLSTLIPSVKRQKKNAQLVEMNLLKEYKQDLIKSIGYKDTKKNHPVTDAPFALSVESLHILPQGWRDLIRINPASTSDVSDEIVGRILLNGVISDREIVTLAHNYPNVIFIDSLNEYKSLFQTYRTIIILLIFSILIGIISFITIKKNSTSAFKVITPVSLSLFTSIGILGICHIPFNLFHAMGLLLVLCIGIDYGLFLYWQRQPHKDKTELVLFANGLAAMTTLLSFGLLALSETGAIHSFGLSVFLGITLSFLLTTLFLGRPIYTSKEKR